MSFNVKSISVFERQFKRLLKKYPSLKKELSLLVKQLKENPRKGISIGKNCYKIRISISGKGKGKSGGARIITHIIFKENTVYLLSIYDKSDIDNLPNKTIIEFLKQIS